MRENLSMTLVLVTGGAGFIGSHLVETLLARGYRVRVLDSLIYGRRAWVPPAAEFVEGDVADLASCRAAMAGAAGVFHLAAVSRVNPSPDSIETTTRDNVLGTQNVLLAARETGAGKIVYSGSSTFYGNQPPPHREYETQGDFLNMYGLTKQVGEQYCLTFDRHFGVPAIVLRYFNVYGPRQPQTGNYALVMGIFLRRWADGNPLIIHGEGSQRRDFVHVRDVVRANILAYESERRGEIYNVGSGGNISVKELADMISPDQRHEARRGGDAEATLADISRIRAHLGWQPEIALPEGLAELKQRIQAGLE
jgi:nucleoside-diphosphate-sugar epimerase